MKKEIEDDQNTSLAIIIGLLIIGVAMIIAAAIGKATYKREGRKWKMTEVYFIFCFPLFTFRFYETCPAAFSKRLCSATCGLIYELLAGTLSSYVLGDSVAQFSIIIGIYLVCDGRWLMAVAFYRKNMTGKICRYRARGCCGRRIFGPAAVSQFCTPLLFWDRSLCVVFLSSVRSSGPRSRC